MRGSIIQPGYLPWLGYFEQLIYAEVFVFLDDVQYTKQDWRNRNRVRTRAKEGWTWLTVPVKVTRSREKVNEVRIDYSQNWIKKHLNIIASNYSTSTYYPEITAIVRKNLEEKPPFLADLDIRLTLDIARYLGLERDIVRSSDIDIKAKDKNRRLVEICRKTGIQRFYDGEKAKQFLDIPLFERNGIAIEFQAYEHPVYCQNFDPFIPYMSVVDLLFNYGKESIGIIAANLRKKFFPVQT